jgi:hypothetical protein
MRVARLPLLFVVAVLFAALLPPWAARSAGMQYVSDVKERFSIGFPAGWKVITGRSDAPAVQGLDPRSDPPYLNVNVVIEALSQPISPAEYARTSKRIMAVIFHEFAVLQEGPARIARRESYYRYYTWRSSTGSLLHQVQAYFTVGRRGFILTGTTANDPRRIRKDVPVIGQIFETFTPKTK